MDVYQIACNLKPGVRDLEFIEGLTRYLGHLRDEGRLESFRILRAKLGLVPSSAREFLIQLEFRDLAQLDNAFTAVSTRSDPLETLHHAVNSQVQDAQFALFRDFPDPQRLHGQEKF